MRALNVWSYSVLVNARQASTNLLATEARALVGKIRTVGDGAERGPIAVVATDDNTVGMVRMFAALAEPIGMRVNAFRQISESVLVATVDRRLSGDRREIHGTPAPASLANLAHLLANHRQ